jgi:cysteinyl-tRNA synthetase
MSTKYLGQPFDIHGGGLENQFPHHECEIAQAEAATGNQFVKYWLHNNMVTVDGQKMGKSLGNFITLKQVFADSPEPKHELLSRKYDSLAVRQFILSSHYRSTLDFSDEALHAAQSGYDKLTDAVIALRKQIKNAPTGPVDNNVANRLKELKEKFETAMDDDLNTSIALSVMFELASLANEQVAKNATGETLAAIDNMFTKLGGDVLGIVKEQYHQQSKGNELMLVGAGVLIEQRKVAKQNKDFATADALRKKIEETGIVLEDKPGGVTGWRMK